MKDFSDFIRMVKDDHYENTKEKINALGMEISFPISEENFWKLADQIVVISSVCTIELLAKYHDWRNTPE